MNKKWGCNDDCKCKFASFKMFNAKKNYDSPCISLNKTAFDGECQAIQN